MIETEHGDCLDVMQKFAPDVFDSCVTDPPYGIRFMGRTWDRGIPGVPYWQAVYRVLKPGGLLLAFGGTRTYHRLTCAIEDAGFEIIDCLVWLYGSGFPKGKSCLKPGWEPIVLARKKGPLWLNVDGCRLEGVKGVPASPSKTDGALKWGNLRNETGLEDGHNPNIGRWPANVVLSHEPECREVGARDIQTGNGGRGIARRETSGYMGNLGDREVVPYSTNGTEMVAAFECVESCAVRMLDEQSGQLHGSGNKADMGDGPDRDYDASSYHVSYVGRANRDYGSQGGGASRFFYCSKASTAERGQGNDHPTVKPLKLMRWLVRLVTPAHGLVLDPFFGSGTTGLACRDEGFNAWGIEKDKHALEIARRRLHSMRFRRLGAG